jgi:hypothetical protein
MFWRAGRSTFCRVVRRDLEGAAIALLLSSLAGCASLSTSWQRWLGFASPSETLGAPVAESTPCPQFPPQSAQTDKAPAPAKAPARSQMRCSGTAGANTQPTEGQSPSTETKPAAVATLGEQGDLQIRSEQLVSVTSTKLGRIDRSKLKPDSAAVYDQANSFVEDARKALHNKDYPAAEGLVRKASVLEAKLEADSAAR